MKTYAQFFTGLKGKEVEAMGDRSIIQIDGRLAFYNKRIIAEVECRTRGFTAYQLFTGTILNPKAISIIKHLD